jgi:hypothetical protein
MRAFLMDHLSVAQFRREKGMDQLAQHIVHQYRLAALHDIQYADSNFVHLDLTREAGDRLAHFRTFTIQSKSRDE